MTFLDLLVIVGGTLCVTGVLTLVAMFLVKGEKARRVWLYIAAGLGLYMGYVGFRINGLSYGPGSVIALVLALGSVASLVLERRFRQQEARQYIPRVLAAVSLAGGMMNAFM